MPRQVHIFGFALILVLTATMFGQTAPAQEERASSWREDLSSVGGDVLNVVNIDGKLTLGDGEARYAAEGSRRAYGTYTLPVRTPVLSRLSFIAAADDRGAAGGGEMQAQALAPLTYTIYATREGLVGGTTANGHVIRTNDRFVALPSRRGLSSRGGTEYSVRLYYPKTGKSATVPVWDVGPWNIQDDYWNPWTIREMWKDLPQGMPEARAAKLDGYNDGKDGFGRTVISPNGIDIADGTFWYDLGMIDNDWVEVTYLWTSGDAPWETIVDNATAGRFTASANWGTSAYSAERYGTNYRYAAPAPVSDAAWFKVNIPVADSYEVFVWYAADAGYNSATPFVVSTASGNKTVRVNQQQNGGRWVSLGVLNLNAGDYNVVGVSRWTSTPGRTIADAVRLVRR